MKTLTAIATLCTFGAIPITAAAQEVPEPEFTFGTALTATVDVTNDGTLDSIEGELSGEMAIGGFFTGIALTSVYQDPTDSVEYEVYLGYGGGFANGLEWAAQYSYIGLDTSGYDGEEVSLEAAFPVSDRVELGAAVIANPDTWESDQEIGVGFDLTDRWALGALVGNSEADNQIYGEIGVGYDAGEGLSFEIVYEDAENDPAVLSFTMGFEWGAWARSLCPSGTKGRPRAALSMSVSIFVAHASALGELEAAARLALAVFLALDHAAVAGEEARGLERRPQGRVVILKRAADAVLDRARLTRQAAALDGAHHVELILDAGHLEGLAQDHLQHGAREIFLDRLAVHLNLAGARLDPDACRGVLAPAGRVSAAKVVAHRFAGHGRLLGRGNARHRFETFEGFDFFRHQLAIRVFLGFIALTSSTSGCCASCGCSAPA